MAKVRMTITEGLAEIKTLNARIDKTGRDLLPFVCRPSTLRDPLEKEGGSVEFVRRQRQSVTDMMTRIADIRMAIEETNLETELTIDKQTRPVKWWLTYRHEIHQKHADLLNRIMVTTADNRRQLMNTQRQRAIATPTNAAASEPTEITANYNETELIAESDGVQKLIGTLDGQLSLINATTFIEV